MLKNKVAILWIITLICLICTIIFWNLINKVKVDYEEVSVVGAHPSRRDIVNKKNRY